MVNVGEHIAQTGCLLKGAIVILNSGGESTRKIPEKPSREKWTRDVVLILLEQVTKSLCRMPF